MESSDPLYRGGSSELISRLLSSKILYNHSSYFKSGEINSCNNRPTTPARYLQYKISGVMFGETIIAEVSG